MKLLSSHCLILLAVMGLIFILIFLTSKASASTITVPDDYSTIQEAVSNAGDGDTIFVRAGTYNENILIDTTTFDPEPASLTLNGEENIDTIINGGGSQSIRIIGEYNIDISGFTIQNGGVLYRSSANGNFFNNIVTGSGGFGVGTSDANVSIYNNVIEDNDGDGIGIGGPFQQEIINNIIRNNGKEGFEAGIRCDTSSAIIVNNLLENNYNGISTVFDNTTIIDTTIINSTKYDILLRIGQEKVTTAINTIFNTVSISSDTSLVVKNYLNISTIDTLGKTLTNADIKILDKDNIIYSSQYFGGSDPKTNSNGEINWILVTDRIYYGSSTPSENKTIVEVYYPNEVFENNPRNVDMSSSHTEVFQIPNKAPSVYITSPTEAQTFIEGETILFSGSAIDPEDGTLPASSLTWESDREGMIGVGTEYSLANLSVGNHKITLSAIDSLGKNSTAQVNITIVIDTDGDGIPDITDPDDDNDNLTDLEESDSGSDPLVPDTDDDGYDDGADAFPLDDSEWLDTDIDGTGNNEDIDDDDDGVADYDDAFPLDASEWKDSDNDGTGDNADRDDDNDGILDIDEPYYIGSIPVAYLILAAILVPVVIVILIFLKRKRTTAQANSHQGIPVQHPIPQSQFIQCPSCNYRFEVAERQRPLMVRCPNCGTEGSLDK